MHGNLIRSLVLLLIFPCCFAAGESLHPFHISTAEMELNKKSGRFEVAIKLHATDLEEALSAQEKRSVNIEKDADAQQLLTSYLETHFFLLDKAQLKLEEEAPSVVDPKQALSKIHYVGHEMKTNWLWIYFEVELLKPGSESQTDENAKDNAASGPMVLINSVLLDVTEGQINTVAVRHAGKKFSLRTTVRQAWADLKLD